jgi:hypothetical protein
VLTDAKIKAAKPREKEYRLSDAGQLYLQVSPAGGRHRRMNYTYGRSKTNPDKPAQKTLAFGSYPSVTLLDARRRRDEAKELLRQGKDPAVEKRIEAKTRIDATGNTFEGLRQTKCTCR